MYLMTAKKIRKLREALGWTATKLAYKIGVAEDAVHRWEWGQRSPNALHAFRLNKLATKYGIDLGGKYGGASR